MVAREESPWFLAEVRRRAPEETSEGRVSCREQTPRLSAASLGNRCTVHVEDNLAIARV